MTIVLYDVPSTLPHKMWNPNVCKVRLSLNFKGIPFTTQWIEYPDIESHSKKLGISPTGKRDDGSPWYTMPFIHDPSTGSSVADSILIAEYLEKTYPDAPKLFPNGTGGLQSAFNDGILANLKTLLPVTYPEMLQYLNPATATYVTPFMQRIKSQNRAEDWKKLEEGMSLIDSWYARNGGKGLYILGEVPSWADIVLASWLVFVRRALGEDSEDWKDLASWNGGRWKKLSDHFRRYEGSV